MGKFDTSFIWIRLYWIKLRPPTLPSDCALGSLFSGVNWPEREAQIGNMFRLGDHCHRAYVFTA
jgi:hypothetical protein